MALPLGLVRGNVEVQTAGELAIVADGIQVGVDHSLVLRVMRTAPSDQRAVATAVVTQLIELGYEAEPALLRANTALSRGPDALANLQAELSALLRIRLPAPTAFDLSSSAVLSAALQHR